MNAPSDPRESGDTRPSATPPVASVSLEVTSQLLEAVVQGTTDAIFVKNLEGRYLLFNEAAARFVGRSAQDVLGRDDTSLFDPISARHVRERDQRIIARGVPETEEETLTSGGITRTFLATKAPYRDAQGRIVGTIGISRDITDRKRADASFLELTEQFRLFIEHAPVAIGMLDAEMRYLATSLRWRQDYGLTGRDLRGHSHYEVFPEIPERWREVHRRCLTGRVERCDEESFLRANGSEQWIRWEVLPWYAGDQTVGGLIIFSEDITERRRAQRRRTTEHAVSHALAEARSVSEAIPRILRAIAEAEGWAFASLWRDTLRNNRLSCELIWHPPDNPAPSLEAITRSLTLDLGQGLPGRVQQAQRVIVVPDVAQDARFIRRESALADGFTSAIGIPITANGRVIGVLDFLSLRRIEPDPALEESLGLLGNLVGRFVDHAHAQEELRRFVALNPAVLYALRVTPSGLKCFWASENIRDMTGFKLETAMQGSWWLDHIHPEDRARVIAANQLAAISEHQVVEFRFRHALGHYIWLRDEKRVLTDAKGEPLEVFGAWSDITDRVRLETQLRQAQKMEALGLLSGGIAHDFNNILGAILGETELAALDLGDEHPVALNVRNISKAARRAATLVRQILSFARQEPGQLQPTDLRAIVEESTRLLRATIPTGIELTCEVPRSPCITLAEETQIQQAIINLGTNAWHALEHRHGRISLNVASVEIQADHKASHPELQPGKHHRIRVVDNGIGMDADTLARIFDPFFTTKGPGRGTGLGLSVVHGIVKAHRGIVTASSQVGVGSVFEIYLPAMAEAPSLLSDPAPSCPQGQRQHILLIDDEGGLTKVITRALDRLGYRVSSFTPVEDALDCLRSDPGSFDLVISDLNMPVMSGIDVTRYVSSIRSTLPVILASGYLTDALLSEAVAAGAKAVLRKPFELSELSRVVHETLNPKSI